MGGSHEQSLTMALFNTLKYYPMGDQAIVLSFADTISEKVNRQIRQFTARIDQCPMPGIIEYVPAYTTITIYYNPLIIGYKEILAALQMIAEDSPKQLEYKAVRKEIPVCYNGPDLAYVAQHNGLTEEEVIRIHSETEYLVHMIGFVPGFPYLGGLDSRIATPRKEVPRLKIEAGAVGIAGEQTGVYPIATPGGWQIIGHTALQLFDLTKPNPSLLEVGDRVRFVPITYDVFIQLKSENHGN